MGGRSWFSRPDQLTGIKIRAGTLMGYILIINYIDFNTIKCIFFKKHTKVPVCVSGTLVNLTHKPHPGTTPMDVKATMLWQNGMIFY